MDRVLVVAAVAAVAIVIAVVARRRGTAAVRVGISVPRHLDRDELPEPTAPWLVLAFTSSTCRTCAVVVEQVTALAADEVAVVVADDKTDQAIHRRYGIDSVPIVVIADTHGAVRESFVGPTTPGQIAASLDALIGA